MTSAALGGASGASDDFESFHGAVEPRLRQALTSRYGAELGREATADALAWAWEHWGRVGELSNPAAYLYRVGQSRTRRLYPAVGHLRANDDKPGLG